MYSEFVVFVVKCKKVWYINNGPKKYTKKGKVLNMVEIISKFLDSLYDAYNFSCIVYADIGRSVNYMTVRDLYLYSKDGQTFILFMKGETKFCFKGDLEYCPTELIDRLVYQFHAIDFNTIEVILYWLDGRNVSLETFK